MSVVDSARRRIGAVFLIAALVVSAPVVAAAAPSAGGTVSGVVTRADTRDPVGSVEVLLFGEEEIVPVLTDADGRYLFEAVPAGEYRMRFVPAAGSDLAATFWPAAATWEHAEAVIVVVGRSVSADMELPIGATLSGTVTRAADGSPVAGVTVFLDGDGGSAVVETDVDGRYRARGLTAGRYIVEFSPPIVDDMPPELAHEYYRGVRAPDLATPVDVAAGANVDGIDAALEATGSISGRVTRSDTGEGVPDATVYFQPSDFTMGFSTTTGPDGAYSLVGVVPGRHYVGFSTDVDDLLDVLWPDASDWQGATAVTVRAAGDTPGIDVALRPAAVVAGAVRFDGRAWSGGGTVTLQPADDHDDPVSSPVGDDGTFRIGKLPPGRYVVSVQPVADAARAASQYYPAAPTRASAEPVQLRAGAVREGIDFDLVRGADVAGVVSSDGELALPAEIVAYRWSGTDWEEAGRTASWDAYSFAHPPGDVAGHYLPAGRYTVGFVADGFCPQFWEAKPTLADADGLEIAAGEDRHGVDALLRPECLPAGTPSQTPTQTPIATPVDRLPEMGGQIPAELAVIGSAVILVGVSVLVRVRARRMARRATMAGAAP